MKAEKKNVIQFPHWKHSLAHANLSPSMSLEEMGELLQDVYNVLDLIRSNLDRLREAGSDSK